MTLTFDDDLRPGASIDTNLTAIGDATVGHESRLSCLREVARSQKPSLRKSKMHARSVALHFMYYNFVKIHQSLRTTPAQAQV